MRTRARRAEKDRVCALEEEMKALRADCNRQLDEMRNDIAKHRSDMLQFRGKYDTISGESSNAHICTYGRDMLWARKQCKTI